MSEKEFTSSAADAQRAIIDGLIASKKGKGGSSQLETKQFADAWVAYVKTVGINDETAGMLYDGFQFAAGEPLYRYIKETHSKTAYVSLMAAKPTQANEQGVALKVTINLFALELSAPTSEDSVRLLAHAIPGLSTNKDGKAFGTLGRSIPKILIKPCVRKTIDAGISIPSKDAAAVLSVLRGPIESFAKNPKGRSIEINVATKLLAWLESQAGVSKPVESTRALSEKKAEDQPEAPTAKSAVDKAQVDEDATVAKETRRPVSERPVRVSHIAPTVGTSRHGEQPNDASSAESATRRVDTASANRSESAVPLDMTSVLTFLASYQREYEDLEKSNARLRDAGRDASSRASRVEASLREAQKEISGLREQVSGLSERYAKLQGEASSLREANESMSADLKAAEEMLGMIDQRDARQADESTRRLASELKVEYRDFLDAADIPMDADLGENMREQLKNVFEILKSNGIEL